MMKQVPTYLALMTLLALSCTKNENLGRIPEDLVFSAVASHTTKAIINTTSYPTGEPFAVQAVFAPDGVSVSEGTTYMDGETVHYESSSDSWRTQENYLWPFEGTMRFFAYSPISGEATLDNQSGVTLPWRIRSYAESQVDLCHATAIERCLGHSKTVPLVFSHALSQVCFKVQPLKYYSSVYQEDDLIQSNIITVVLDSLKIGGIVSEGVFVQNPAEWTLDPDSATEFTLYKKEGGLALECDKYDNPVLTEISTMLMIPQTLSRETLLEEWHHVHVRTSVTNKVSKEVVSDIEYDIVKSEKICLRDHCRSWDMDNKYTFRVSLGLDPAVVSVAWTDWTESKEIVVEDVL